MFEGHDAIAILTQSHSAYSGHLWSTASWLRFNKPLVNWFTNSTRENYPDPCTFSWADDSSWTTGDQCNSRCAHERFSFRPLERHHASRLNPLEVKFTPEAFSPCTVCEVPRGQALKLYYWDRTTPQGNFIPPDLFDEESAGSNTRTLDVSVGVGRSIMTRQLPSHRQ